MKTQTMEQNIDELFALIPLISLADYLSQLPFPEFSLLTLRRTG